MSGGKGAIGPWNGEVVATATQGSEDSRPGCCGELVAGRWVVPEVPEALEQNLYGRRDVSVKKIAMKDPAIRSRETGWGGEMA